MGDIMIDFMGTIFKDVDYRGLVYITLVFEGIVALLFLFIANAVTTGSGVCLGVKFGKTNYFKAAIKYIFLGAGLLLSCNEVLFLVLDFFGHMSWGYLFVGFIGLFLFVVFAICAFMLGQSRDEKVAKKYSKEIEEILFANPMFEKTIRILNANPAIKRIHIYRDGIAFFEHQGEIPVCTEETFDKGAWDYASASKMLKSYQSVWLAENSTVSRSGSDNFFKFSDFGYASSETAMKEFPSHIDKYATGDFSRNYRYEKKWVYSAKLHDAPTLYAAGGQIRSTSASERTLSASKKAWAYVVVMGEKKTFNNKKPPKRDRTSQRNGRKQFKSPRHRGDFFVDFCGQNFYNGIVKTVKENSDE